ncbi:hypothetical protein DXM26_17775 [Agrobacterium tumefaciens]|nr:hypothetical protein DXM26_17775 [Agrobacterium tumefaciens]
MPPDEEANAAPPRLQYLWVFQYIRNAETNVVQEGDKGSGVTFRYEWRRSRTGNMIKKRRMTG